MGAQGLRDALFGFDRQRWTVEVRGKTFGLLEPTGIVVQEYADKASELTGVKGPGLNVAAYRSMAWLLVRCLCDPETGELLFKPEEDGLLLERVPGDVVSALWSALTQRTKARGADMGKESEATPVSSSG